MDKNLVAEAKRLEQEAFQEWLEAAKKLVELNNSLFKDKIEEQTQWEQGGTAND